MTMRKTITLAVLCAALSASFAVAAPQPEFASLQGHEKKAHKDTVLSGKEFSGADTKRMFDQLHRMRDMVLAAPAIASLRGHDWETFDAVRSVAMPGRPAVGEMSYIPFAYFRDPRSGKPVSSEEGPPFHLYVNFPEILRQDVVYDIDGDAHFMTEPRLTGNLDGFPVYEDQYVVLAKRPLFAPVTQEQYLKRLIEKARTENAGLHAKLPAGGAQDKAANAREIAGLTENIRLRREEAEKRWALMGKWPDRVAAERTRFDEKERKFQEEIDALRGGTPNQRFTAAFDGKLAELEQELRGMPAGERGAPAYLPADMSRRGRASGLAPFGSTDGRRIVTFHPQLFDPKKPRGAVQLIVIGTPRYAPELYQPLQRQLDKQALAAMVE
jgi:hypothetical protein